MTDKRLLVIEEKIKRLKAKHDMLSKKEAIRNRKLLVKQKIVLGGYYLNQVKSMGHDEKQDLKAKIMSTLKRKSDIDAINSLLS